MGNAHTILIAECLGFCGGVQRAVRLFEETKTRPLYVLHELVHNHTVTSAMAAEGAHFIASPSELPQGASVMIGAHGISPEIEAALRARAGLLIDATCPIVKQVQQAASRLTPDDELVLYGLAGHPEAEGILGHAGTPHRFLVSNAADIAALPALRQPVMLCQTTLNHADSETLFAALQARFPNARRNGAICHASFDRQTAVEKLVRKVDALLVIGSANSSNANRLKEIGEAAGIPSWLIEGPEQFPPRLAHYPRLGIAAGASTPPEQIQKTIRALNCPSPQA